LHDVLRGVLVADEAARERAHELAVLEQGFGADREGLGGHGIILLGVSGFRQEDTARASSAARNPESRR
jgi:hypothetical protein